MAATLNPNANTYSDIPHGSKYLGCQVTGGWNNCLIKAIRFTTSISYVQVFLYMDTSGTELDDGAEFHFIQLRDISDNPAASIRTFKDGADIKWEFECYDDGAWKSDKMEPLIVVENVWERYDLKLDITNDAWETRLNGESKAGDSFVDPAGTRIPKQLWTGIIACTEDDKTITIGIDDVQWDVGGYMGLGGVVPTGALYGPLFGPLGGPL